VTLLLLKHQTLRGQPIRDSPGFILNPLTVMLVDRFSILFVLFGDSGTPIDFHTPGQTTQNEKQQNPAKKEENQRFSLWMNLFTKRHFSLTI
jgi:hypothetical protein